MKYNFHQHLKIHQNPLTNETFTSSYSMLSLEHNLNQHVKIHNYMHIIGEYSEIDSKWINYCYTAQTQTVSGFSVGSN